MDFADAPDDEKRALPLPTFSDGHRNSFTTTKLPFAQPNANSPRLTAARQFSLSTTVPATEPRMVLTSRRIDGVRSGSVPLMQEDFSVVSNSNFMHEREDVPYLPATHDAATNTNLRSLHAQISHRPTLEDAGRRFSEPQTLPSTAITVSPMHSLSLSMSDPVAVQCGNEIGVQTQAAPSKFTVTVEDTADVKQQRAESVESRPIQRSSSEDLVKLDFGFLSALPLVRESEETDQMEIFQNYTAFDEEFQRIYEILHHGAKQQRLLLTIQDDVASMKTLSEVLLRRPRVLHISCHGGYTGNEQIHQSENRFYLAFEDVYGKLEAFSVHQLRELLRHHPQFIKNLECVLITSCFSLPAARVFQEAGVSYVVGIHSQSKVRDDVSTTFCEAFYTRLLVDFDVEYAFKVAKNRVLNQPIRTCCCSHLHKADCPWLGIERHKYEMVDKAHSFHQPDQLCRCPGKKKHIHEPECDWLKNALHFVDPKYRQFYVDGKAICVTDLPSVSCRVELVECLRESSLNIDDREVWLMVPEYDGSVVFGFVKLETREEVEKLFQFTDAIDVSMGYNGECYPIKLSRVKYCCCSPELPHNISNKFKLLKADTPVSHTGLPFTTGSEGKVNAIHQEFYKNTSPANVPPVPETFMGRNSLLYTVTLHLMTQQYRCIGFIGPSGMGKHTFVCALASHLLRRHHSNAVIVIFIDCSHMTTASQILQEIGKQIGVPEITWHSLQRIYYQKRRIVVILSKCDDILGFDSREFAKVLDGILKCRAWKLVFTAKDFPSDISATYLSDVHETDMPPLALRHAGMLFVKVARNYGNLSPQTLDEIKTGKHPILGLLKRRPGLIQSHARQLRHHTLEDIMLQLQEEDDPVGVTVGGTTTAGGPVRVSGHWRTVESSVRRACSHVGGGIYALFAALSIFVTGVELVDLNKIICQTSWPAEYREWRKLYSSWCSIDVIIETPHSSKDIKRTLFKLDPGAIEGLRKFLNSDQVIYYRTFIQPYALAHFARILVLMTDRIYADIVPRSQQKLDPRTREKIMENMAYFGSLFNDCINEESCHAIYGYLTTSREIGIFPRPKEMNKYPDQKINGYLNQVSLFCVNHLVVLKELENYPECFRKGRQYQKMLKMIEDPIGQMIIYRILAEAGLETRPILYVDANVSATEGVNVCRQVSSQMVRTQMEVDEKKAVDFQIGKLFYVKGRVSQHMGQMSGSCLYDVDGFFQRACTHFMEAEARNDAAKSYMRQGEVAHQLYLCHQKDYYRAQIAAKNGGGTTEVPPEMIGSMDTPGHDGKLDEFKLDTLSEADYSIRDLIPLQKRFMMETNFADETVSVENPAQYPFKEAKTMFQTAMKLFEEEGNWLQYAVVNKKLALLFKDAGQLSNAHRFAKRAKRKLEAINEKIQFAEVSRLCDELVNDYYKEKENVKDSIFFLECRPLVYRGNSAENEQLLPVVTEPCADNNRSEWQLLRTIAKDTQHSLKVRWSLGTRNAFSAMTAAGCQILHIAARGYRLSSQGRPRADPFDSIPLSDKNGELQLLNDSELRLQLEAMAVEIPCIFLNFYVVPELARVFLENSTSYVITLEEPQPNPDKSNKFIQEFYEAVLNRRCRLREAFEQALAAIDDEHMYRLHDRATYEQSRRRRQKGSQRTIVSQEPFGDGTKRDDMQNRTRQSQALSVLDGENESKQKQNQNMYNYQQAPGSQLQRNVAMESRVLEQNRDEQRSEDGTEFEQKEMIPDYDDFKEDEPPDFSRTESGNTNDSDKKIGNEEFFDSEPMLLDKQFVDLTPSLHASNLSQEELNRTVDIRGQDQFQIMNKLVVNRFVNVFGPTGVGKTFVTKQVGQQFRLHGTFPDGVFYIDISQCTCKRDVEKQICNVLSIPSQTMHDLQPYLNERKICLILDDCSCVSKENAAQFDFVLRVLFGIHTVHLILVSRKPFYTPQSQDDHAEYQQQYPQYPPVIPPAYGLARDASAESALTQFSSDDTQTIVARKTDIREILFELRPLSQWETAILWIQTQRRFEVEQLLERRMPQSDQRQLTMQNQNQNYQSTLQSTEFWQKINEIEHNSKLLDYFQGLPDRIVRSSQMLARVGFLPTVGLDDEKEYSPEADSSSVRSGQSSSRSGRSQESESESTSVGLLPPNSPQQLELPKHFAFSVSPTFQAMNPKFYGRSKYEQRQKHAKKKTPRENASGRGRRSGKKSTTSKPRYRKRKGDKFKRENTWEHTSED